MHSLYIGVRACLNSLAIVFTFRLYSRGTGRRGWKAFRLIRPWSIHFVDSASFEGFLWSFLKDRRHSFIRTSRAYKQLACSPKASSAKTNPVRDPLLWLFDLAVFITGGLPHPMGLVRLGRRFHRFTRRRPGGFDETRDSLVSGGRENQWWDGNIREPFGSKSLHKSDVCRAVFWSPQMVRKRGIGNSRFIVMDGFADPYRRSGAQYVYDW